MRLAGQLRHILKADAFISSMFFLAWGWGGCLGDLERRMSLRDLGSERQRQLQTGGVQACDNIYIYIYMCRGEVLLCCKTEAKDSTGSILYPTWRHVRHGG